MKASARTGGRCGGAPPLPPVAPPDSEDALVRQFAPLARRALYRLVRVHQREDYYTDALAAVLEAVRTHEPGGRSLKGWVCDTVQRRLHDAIRLHGPYTRRGRCRHPAVRLAHPVPARTPAYDPVDEADACAAILRPLPHRHRLVAHLVWVEGLWHRQAAELVGVSESRVTQLLAEARRILRGEEV